MIFFGIYYLKGLGELLSGFAHAFLYLLTSFWNQLWNIIFSSKFIHELLLTVMHTVVNWLDIVVMKKRS